MSSDNHAANPPLQSRDWQPVVVAASGLFVVGLITIIAVFAFPGPTPAGQVNTAGQNIVSVATAAITAVAAVVGAYFGVKAANSAREDTAQRLQTAQAQSINALQTAHDDAQKTAKRSEILLSTMASALPGDQAKDLLQAADQRIKSAGL